MVWTVLDPCRILKSLRPRIVVVDVSGGWLLVVVGLGWMCISLNRERVVSSTPSTWSLLSMEVLEATLSVPDLDITVESLKAVSKPDMMVSACSSERSETGVKAGKASRGVAGVELVLVSVGVLWGQHCLV